MLETFIEFHEAVNNLKKEIRYEFAYILIELAVKLDTNRDIYDNNLNVRKECPFWVKLRAWIFYKCYSYGCYLYR